MKRRLVNVVTPSKRLCQVVSCERERVLLSPVHMLATYEVRDGDGTRFGNTPPDLAGWRTGGQLAASPQIVRGLPWVFDGARRHPYYREQGTPLEPTLRQSRVKRTAPEDPGRLQARDRCPDVTMNRPRNMAAGVRGCQDGRQGEKMAFSRTESPNLFDGGGSGYQDGHF